MGGYTARTLQIEDKEGEIRVGLLLFRRWGWRCRVVVVVAMYGVTAAELRGERENEILGFEKNEGV